MASAELASASYLGPRYAPEDPTLPKPWKGLVDGNTGLLYYWNPETNVTQYDRPASLAPPLPPGPPPSASTQNLAPLHAASTLPTDGSVMQQQQCPPPVQQHQLVAEQVPSQNLQQQTYQNMQSVVNQQPQQPYPQFQLQHVQYPQVSYLPGQLVGQIQGQQQQQQGPQFPFQQQLQQQGIQLPYIQQQGFQGSYAQQQSQQVSQDSQQMQVLQAPYQQQPQPPRIPFAIGQQPGQQQHGQQQQGQQQLDGQQNVVYQQEKESQGQQIASSHQGHQFGVPTIEESVRQEGKQAGFSLPQVQQNGFMPSHHQLLGVTAAQVQDSGGTKVVHSQLQQQQFGGSPSDGQEFGGLPSSGLHFGGRPGGQQFGPFSGDQQFSALSSGGKQSVEHLAGVSSVQLQQAGTDVSFREQHMGSHIIRNQVEQLISRSMGSQMVHGEDRRDRWGSEFYSSSKIEEPTMSSHQSKFAPPRCTRNPQETGGAVNPQFVSSGHSGWLDMVPGHGMPNMQNYPPFRSAVPVRPPSKMFDSTECTNINPANAYRAHHEVTAVGDNIPTPFMTFEATGFPPEILREMHLAGFVSPTPIQAQTWPIALQSRDIVAIANTGSGKTLGYLIPAFIHIRRCQNNPQFGPKVLVLAPTRELATQIQDEALKFGCSSRVSCTCLYGGAPKGPQLKEIEHGADIVVATPGRLNDILEMRKINFHQISLLVLDEADRMLDMGFEPQIRKIVNEIPLRRQTLMYTATWPKEVRKIASDLLVNPVQVTIGSVDELAANKSITQFVEVVPPMDKERRLEQILRNQERGSKIIIFCSTKKLCDQLANSLGRHFGAASIHGDKSQGERDHALHQFRCGRAPILVATDVAARGLDIKDIRVVINYDFPTGIEDYVHRIGRTGRAGATGVSYTFFSGQDQKHAAELVKVLEGADQRVPPELRDMAARGCQTAFSRAPHGGMSRWDPNGAPDGGWWDSSGVRGSGGQWVGPRGGGGRRDTGGGGRSGMRDFVGVAGRGGNGGGRNDFHGGRGNARGRGFSGPGGPVAWGRHDRGPRDRYYNHPDARGWHEQSGRRGFGERSRDRCYSRSPKELSGRRGFGERSRDRCYSRSPEKVRTRGGSNLSRSRSPSWSRSRSRSRSWSRSRSRSYDRYKRVPRSLFTDAPEEAAADGDVAPRLEAPPSVFTDTPEVAVAAADGGDGEPRFAAPELSESKDGTLSCHISTSPCQASPPTGNEVPDQVAAADGGSLVFVETETVSEPVKLHEGGDL
ncbi:putative DEAD-box ATP-dependent RNA helicase 40 isoform X1 [Iris pallida]|uniref:RNA helicase n=1 Tax=Iris pallida TaxID=29817 RepID=A0AAX6I6L1_IRIPA|nr:putative DEAD-box ATP-dependent RNA helicase 40 isoform X1 [Iris pallida]